MNDGPYVGAPTAFETRKMLFRFPNHLCRSIFVLLGLHSAVSSLVHSDPRTRASYIVDPCIRTVSVLQLHAAAVSSSLALIRTRPPLQLPFSANTSRGIALTYRPSASDVYSIWEVLFFFRAWEHIQVGTPPRKEEGEVNHSKFLFVLLILATGVQLRFITTYLHLTNGANFLLLGVLKTYITC